MSVEYRAAVLHAVRAPMRIETVSAGPLDNNDVLVRIKAAGLCHTDLEVITGSLRYPMPIVLGHEAAGVVEAVGPAARGIAVGDHVILSWTPPLRPLLLLRPRPADPGRELSGARTQGSGLRRRSRSNARNGGFH